MSEKEQTPKEGFEDVGKGSLSFMRVEEGDRGTQEVFVTLATGYEVECRPVFRQFMTVGNSVVDPPGPPKPPQYEMHGAGGATEKRDHDKESIEDPKTDPKEKVAWVKYIKRLAKYDAKCAENATKRNEMGQRYIALRGIRLKPEDLPDDLEVWAAEQELLFGIAPDDDGLPRATNLLMTFLGQEVFGNQTDGQKITSGMMYASGLEQEAIQQMADLFRDQMGNNGESGTDTEGDSSGVDQAESTEE